jgi:hypothetical protein
MQMPGMRLALLLAALPVKSPPACARGAWVNFIWPIFVTLTGTSSVRCTGSELTTLLA